jgi:tetratricopeptide (TPR) repeat protein
MLNQLIQKLKVVQSAKVRLPLLGLGLAILLAVLIFLLWRVTTPPQISPYERSKQLYLEGHYSESVEVLRQQILNNPKDYDSHLLIAQNFIALQQWQPAQGYLREHLLKKGETPTALYWMSVAQMGDKKLDFAETNLRRLIALNDPELKGRARLTLAELYYRTGNFSLAANTLYEALTVNAPFDPPEEQRAKYLYAVLLTRDTRFQDAATQFKQASQVKTRGYWTQNAPVQWRMSQTNEKINLALARLPEKPQDRQEAVNRIRAAYVLLTIEEYAVAEENLNRVLELVPDYHDARAYLGSVLWRSGRIPQARSTFNTVIKQDAKNRLARQFLVQMLIEQLQLTPPDQTNTDQYRQDFQTAQTLLTELIKELSDDPLLWMDAARLYLISSDYEQASKAYWQAVTLNRAKPNPNLNPEANLVRIFTEMRVEPCRFGINTAEALVKNAPSDADTWFTAGLSNLVCINPDKAIEYFQRAWAIKPYSPETAYRLYQAYVQKGLNKEADKWYYLATDIEPRRRWAKYN